MSGSDEFLVLQSYSWCLLAVKRSHVSSLYLSCRARVCNCPWSRCFPKDVQTVQCLERSARCSQVYQKCLCIQSWHPENNKKCPVTQWQLSRCCLVGEMAEFQEAVYVCGTKCCTSRITNQVWVLARTHQNSTIKVEQIAASVQTMKKTSYYTL